MTSAIFAEAAQKWSDMRSEFSATLEAHYISAELATNGHMLNKQGRARGIDPYSLISGSATRAYKYASDELIEYWNEHPRPNLAHFEADWLSIQRGW